MSGPGGSGGKGLTRQEFDAVIRRAAEIASSEMETESLPESELFRIAREVGLGEQHVREALAEVRSPRGSAGLLDRVFGPAVVRAWRVVPGAPDRLSAALDDHFVSTQLLQRVRRGPGRLQYRPSLDWASQLARALGTTKRSLVSGARSVEVRLEAVDDARTMVEIQLEPGTRGDSVAGATVGGGLAGLGGGAGVVAAVVATGGAVAVAVPLGVAVAGAFGAGVTWLVGDAHRKKVREVLSEVEGILDSLEAGEGLELPPPGWRTWVKRQFQGVARDLTDRQGGR